MREKELEIAVISDGGTTHYQRDTTVLSKRHGNKVVQGNFLPDDLKKYVKNRPYLLIHDKYVSTKKVSSQEIKRAFKKYDWTRVLSDKTGFYIVFNSLKECERCFQNEDCRHFYEFRLVMEMAIPEHYQEVEKENDFSNSVINEATNILIKEFETFLVKDIRERIIAPQILSLLDHDRYPALVEELKAKEKEQALKSKLVMSNMDLKQNAMSILEKQKRELQEKIPYFKRAEERLKESRRGNKRPIIPMLHALNLDEDEEEIDNDDLYESVSGSMTPLAEPLKEFVAQLQLALLRTLKLMSLLLNDKNRSYRYHMILFLLGMNKWKIWKSQKKLQMKRMNLSHRLILWIQSMALLRVSHQLCIQSL